MTRDEAIKLILLKCGRREKDTVLQAAAVSEMALAQQTVLEQTDFKPWFLLSETLRAATGVNEARMPLPDRFLEEHEEGLLWIRPPGSSIYLKLVRDDEDTLSEYYSERGPGLPERYSIVKDYIILYPTPDQVYPLKMRCYQGEPTLTYDYGTEVDQAVTTNAWLKYAPDWLIGVVGAELAGQYIKDKETAADFKEKAVAARARLYVQHVAREEMNRSRSAGDD